MTDDNYSWLPPSESPGETLNAEENAKKEEAHPVANLMEPRNSFAVKLLNLILSVLAIGLLIVVLWLWPTPGLGWLFLVAYYLAITLPYVLILLIFVVLPVLCVVYLIVKRILYVVHLIVKCIKRKAK